MNRPMFDDNDVKFVMDKILDSVVQRIRCKGRHILTSSHEIFGIVTEEYGELIDAVRSDDLGRIDHELCDLAVACAIGLISVYSKKMDWPITKP